MYLLLFKYADVIGVLTTFTSVLTVRLNNKNDDVQKRDIYVKKPRVNKMLNFYKQISYYNLLIHLT